MYSHPHEMDRSYSQHLSSRGNSELGSRYMVESGFYMAPLVAAIFIGGLIIVGFLLITVLIALSVMLQSCEKSKSAGIIETPRDDHNYCKVYALHAELNDLEEDSFPSVCKEYVKWYMEDQYSKDLRLMIQVADDYFNSVMPLDDGLDAVLMDIDDIFPSNSHFSISLPYGVNKFGYDDCVGKAKRLRGSTLLNLYLKLLGSRWNLILFSRKPEKDRNATIDYLSASGYGGWSSLIMRSDSELQMDDYSYFSKRRAILQEQGYRITGSISIRIDALMGPFLGKRVFKLPNPVYCNPKKLEVESIRLQKLR